MKELIRFQTTRGLNEQEHLPINESANILEELLESIGLDIPKENRPALKEAYNDFVDKVIDNGIAVRNNTSFGEHEQVDAYCDIITFAIGAIMKLGYEPTACIVECGKEINSRVGHMVDGKFEKALSKEAKLNWYKADYSTCKLYL